MASLFERLHEKYQDEQSSFRKMNRYLHGDASPSYLGINLPKELLKLQVRLNWCRVVAEAYASRIRVAGFRTDSDSDEFNEDLWKLWRDNEMDVESTQVILEALGIGRAYISVDKGQDGAIIRAESARWMTTVRDPRTREVEGALRIYGGDPRYDIPERATLYLPDETQYLVQAGGKWVSEGPSYKHGLGEVPVVPFVRRTAIGDECGESVFSDVIELQDAAQRALVDLAAAVEFAALPQKLIAGLTPEDVTAEDGTMLTEAQMYVGNILTFANENLKTHQFTAADLSAFVKVIEAYAAMASSVSGVPEQYFAITPTANPTSADALRASESRLVKNAELLLSQFRLPFGKVMQLAAGMSEKVETEFDDPGTPTKAQAADAASKLLQAGITTVEQARIDVGYTPIERERMRNESGDDALARLAAVYGTEPNVPEGNTAGSAPAAAQKPSAPKTQGQPKGA